MYSQAFVRAQKIQPQDIKSVLDQNVVCQWALTSEGKKLYLKLLDTNCKCDFAVITKDVSGSTSS